MKLEKFKEKDNKRTGIIVFTIVCIMLVCGAVLYRTFAIFEVRTNQNVIKGTVQDPGNIYFAFYQKNDANGEYEIQKDMPSFDSGLVLDEESSYCGVNGETNDKITVSLTEDWRILVSGVTTSRTKCNLYFTQGRLIMGHGIPVVENGDGLYEVSHTDLDGTINKDGFSKTEFRYAGVNPNNYVKFNDELWRIIGLVNVMTSETDVEQRIKIVRKDSIGNYAWDRNQNYTNDWTNSKLMEMLNNGYYNSLSDVECYTETNRFNSNKSTCNFKETSDTQTKGLNEFSRNYIEDNIIWNIGGGTTNVIDVSTFYQTERDQETGNDNQVPYLWKSSEIADAKIGLIYPSDYGYATSGGTFGREQCLKKTMNSWANDECTNNDWLKPVDYFRLFLFPHTKNNWAFYTRENGYIEYELGNCSANPVYPTLYLKNNVKFSAASRRSLTRIHKEIP